MIVVHTYYTPRHKSILVTSNGSSIQSLLISVVLLLLLLLFVVVVVVLVDRKNEKKRKRNDRVVGAKVNRVRVRLFIAIGGAYRNGPATVLRRGGGPSVATTHGYIESFDRDL